MIYLSATRFWKGLDVSSASPSSLLTRPPSRRRPCNDVVAHCATLMLACLEQRSLNWMEYSQWQNKCTWHLPYFFSAITVHFKPPCRQCFHSVTFLLQFQFPIFVDLVNYFETVKSLKQIEVFHITEFHIHTTVYIGINRQRSSCCGFKLSSCFWNYLLDWKPSGDIKALIL